MGFDIIMTALKYNKFLDHPNPKPPKMRFGLSAKSFADISYLFRMSPKRLADKTAFIDVSSDRSADKSTIVVISSDRSADNSTVFGMFKKMFADKSIAFGVFKKMFADKSVTFGMPWSRILGFCKLSEASFCSGSLLENVFCGESQRCTYAER
ncbi:MAG: hypothetical protein IKY42_01125 [Bacteroidaceae bacterium]|nr:hypothetical protein [Bacteroidaceae bacterium]